MCELELSNELPPGSSGIGVLRFAPSVSEAVKAIITLGSSFDLAEGNRVIGSAHVLEIV